MTKAESAMHAAITELWQVAPASLSRKVETKVRVRVEELESGVRAALRMVEGDGVPPNWDWLRSLVSR